jgi:hypothetical protein
MTSMRKVLRFGKKPLVMCGIGSCDERKRPTEAVIHLLIMPLIPEETTGAPRPSRRKLPSGNVEREMRCP